MVLRCSRNLTPCSPNPANFTRRRPRHIYPNPGTTRRNSATSLHRRSLSRGPSSPFHLATDSNGRTSVNRHPRISHRPSKNDSPARIRLSPQGRARPPPPWRSSCARSRPPLPLDPRVKRPESLAAMSDLRPRECGEVLGEDFGRARREQPRRRYAPGAGTLPSAPSSQARNRSGPTYPETRAITLPFPSRRAIVG